jgi:Nif-specific regulatory protein
MNYLRDQILQSRYKVNSLLGEGGMGSTYLVYDEVKKERVALKVLNLRDENSITAFKSEFEVLSKFRHPNLVSVFEFGLLDDKIPFYTMEFVDGKNIKEFFNADSKNELDINLIYRTTVQILLSLDYIHNRKIIHGDIKPENIFIQQKQNEKPIAKLLDFGLSQNVLSKQQDGFTGTLEYISPEKIKKENIDGRSDLYSLGIVLYEILTGDVPFNEKETLKLFRRQLFEEITKIDSRFIVAEEFKKIIIRLLRKEPCDRYQTAFNAAKDTALLYGEALSDDDSITKEFYFTSGPLTGRDNELKQLIDFIGSENNTAKFAIISGESGIGKTRLLKELKIRSQLCGSSFIDIPILEKSVNAFIPVFSIVNEVKRFLSDSDIEKYGKLIDIIKQDYEIEGAEKSRVYDETSFILEIIDVIIAAAKTEKLVIAFDGLNNADGGTIDFIEYFERNLELNPNKNISVVVTVQPEMSTDVDELIKEIENNSKLLSIKLTGVGKEQIANYIRSTLGVESLPEQFLEKLTDETSGNFLFIEEILKVLLEEGFIYRKEGKFEIKSEVELPKLPGSVVDAFKARFEKFSGEEKELLYKLSVLSGNFDNELTLVASGFDNISLNQYLRRFLNEGLFIAGPDGYRFKSEKIKNILYDEFSRDKKKAVHGIIADYYKNLLHDNKSIYTELLSYHLFSAERFGEAIPLLTKSGDKAREIFANLEAEDFYKKAILSMEKIGEKFSMGKYSVYSKLADVYDLSGKRDEGSMVLNNMLKIAEKFLDNHKISDTYILQSKLFYAIGEYEKAKNIGEKAVTLKERIDDQKGKANALVAVGSAVFKMGEVQPFLKYYDEAIKIFEELGCDIEYGLALVDLGIAYWSNLDTPEKAIEYYEKALAIFEKANYPKGKLRAIGNTALAYYTLGKYEKSLECLYEVKKICEETGNRKGLCTALVNIGNLFLIKGRFSEALSAISHCLTISILIGDQYSRRSCYENFGKLYDSLGQHLIAYDYYEQALNNAIQTTDRSSQIINFINLSFTSIRLDRIEKANEYLSKAESLIDENSDLISRINLVFPKVLLLICKNIDFDISQIEKLISYAIELSIQCSEVDSEIYCYFLLSYVYLKIEKNAEALEQSQKAIRKINELNYIPTDLSEILWNHYLILKAKGEKNLSIETLKKAYNHVINISKNITDLSMRESYLEKAEPNASIVKEYKNMIAGVSVEDSSAKIRLNNLETLYRITQKIISILDLDELLNAVMDLALETLKGERGMIFLLEDDELRLKAARNVEKQSVKDASEISSSVLNDVALGGKPILTMDAMGDEKLMQRQSIMNYNIKSLVCVPIKLKEKILGTVYVDSTGSSESIVAFTSIDLEFLEAFAGVVAISIENARLLKELKDENVYLRNEVEEKYRFENIIGNSEALQKVYKIMEGAIRSEGTVMIQGESGTGKELVAKAIHFNSARKKERFIAVDCAALHETLLDSELFGHKKGSFTGAIQDKKGLFEEADKGTIFLDEITNTSLAFQAKLLRVLQEGEIRRVGDTDSKFVNVRVIAAANKNIEEEVRLGRFREDLYYRLNVIPIFVPPLRERREDIPLLVDHFVKKYQTKTSKVIKSISQELVDRFTAYDWPGNIRELENIINRMIIFAEEEKLTLKDIPSDFQKIIGKSDMVSEIFKNNDEISNIKELEKEHILRTLQKTGGNKSEAAKLLGLKRTTLIERMKKYGLMTK